MIISKEKGKTFHESHLFKIKTLNKVEIKGELRKPIVNNTLKSEMLEALF